MAQRLAPSRNCSEFRTMQLECVPDFVHDHPMPRRYTTPAALVASPAADHIWKAGSSDVQSSEHVHSSLPAPPNRGPCLQPNSYLHLPSRCWFNRSSGQTFPCVLSDFQHLLSGTRWLKQFWSATLCLFLNPDLKHFCSIRRLLNSDPTCRQRVRSYDRNSRAISHSGPCVSPASGQNIYCAAQGGICRGEAGELLPHWIWPSLPLVCLKT